ncbi:MAG: hypothetical protein ACPLPV_04140, partial [Methanomassiliicoccales archaeon]
ERIIFAYLVEKLRFVPGVDFDFQSSLDGGRLELGGIVADFLFPLMKIIINPIGSHHNQLWYSRRDDEQRIVLERMGYRVYMIEENDVYDEYKLENFMRMVFGLPNTFMAGFGAHQANESQYNQYEIIYLRIVNINNTLANYFGSFWSVQI